MRALTSECRLRKRGWFCGCTFCIHPASHKDMTCVLLHRDNEQRHIHQYLFLPSLGDCSGIPNLYNVSEKYWRYTSNLYHSMPPICHAVPRWLLLRGNKRCFLNGVFQSGVLRGWSGSTRAEGTQMLEKHRLFLGILRPAESVYLCRKPRLGI